MEPQNDVQVIPETLNVLAGILTSGPTSVVHQQSCLASKLDPIVRSYGAYFGVLIHPTPL